MRVTVVTSGVTPRELHTCSVLVSWLRGKVNGDGNRRTGNLWLQSRPQTSWNEIGEEWKTVSDRERVSLSTAVV